MDNILKISEAASLAMHACTYLAKQNGVKASTKEIAQVLGASEHHLAKVMQRLAKAGLVIPARGPKGGFTLARAPRKISLLNIYEAIEGDFGASNCLLSSKVCKGDKCILGGLLKTLNSEVLNYLKGTRLSEIDNVYSQE
jgi:Rrf2 family protein